MGGRSGSGGFRVDRRGPHVPRHRGERGDGIDVPHRPDVAHGLCFRAELPLRHRRSGRAAGGHLPFGRLRLQLDPDRDQRRDQRRPGLAHLCHRCAPRRPEPAPSGHGRPPGGLTTRRPMR
ncbi:MAG: hypothetical protein MZU91_10675 [Desulfosudis oleivorans]|nr:hypothetical protein [Desulfosudis oleivorans]